MKNLRSKITLFTLLFMPLFLFGQNAEYGIAANMGGSWLSLEWSDFEGSNPMQFSYDLGFFYDKKINQKWSFGAELSYAHFKSVGRLESRRSFFPSELVIGSGGMPVVIINQPAQSGNNFTLINDTGVENTMNYIILPVYVKYGGERIAAWVAFQTMFLSFASEKRNGKVEDLEGVARMDYGIRPGVEMKITPKLSMRSDFYIGMKSLVEDKNYLPRKNRQFTIGLNYYLTK